MLTLPNTVLDSPAKLLSWPTSISTSVAVAMIAGALGVLLGSYVCVAALMAEAISHGQTTDLAMLIFPHYFEHSFTYLIVPIIAVLVCRLGQR